MLVEKTEKKIIAKAIKKIKKHEALADSNMESLSLYLAQTKNIMTCHDEQPSPKSSQPNPYVALRHSCHVL